MCSWTLHADSHFWSNVFEPFVRYTCTSPNPKIFQVRFYGFFSNVDIAQSCQDPEVTEVDVSFRKRLVIVFLSPRIVGFTEIRSLLLRVTI